MSNQITVDAFITKGNNENWMKVIFFVLIIIPNKIMEKLFPTINSIKIIICLGSLKVSVNFISRARKDWLDTKTKQQSVSK